VRAWRAGGRGRGSGSGCGGRGRGTGAGRGGRGRGAGGAVVELPVLAMELLMRRPMGMEMVQLLFACKFYCSHASGVFCGQF
jgi:hypothetical protein